MDEVPTPPRPNNLLTPLFALNFLLIGGVAGFYLAKSSLLDQLKPKPKEVACTMEVKTCPDGSYVGRSGPACEFASCPTPDQSISQECGVCGPKGIHNLEGKSCASGLECKNSDGNIASSVSFCVKPRESISKCL